VLDRKTIGTESFYERHKSIGSLDGNKAGNMNEYLSITKDNDNNLWIATYRNGVWKYDGKEIRHYSIQENGKDINLFYIYNDKIGNTWLGTHQNGIWKLMGEKFERLKL
jgi:ligand-binding sensor domain-containing protein